MAFFNALGSSGLKEISTSLLDLITWDGGKRKLRVYAKTAKNWKSIARKLGLEDESPGYIKNTAQRHFNDDQECVTEVFGKWLENAVGLPNADQFPKSWEGLLNLLNESELGEVAKELRTAIEAPDSSAIGGKNEIMMNIMHHDEIIKLALNVQYVGIIVISMLLNFVHNSQYHAF